MIGSAYPPDIFSFIKDTKLRNSFEKLAIETEEDLQQLSKVLQDFDVEVIRPTMSNNFEDFKIDNGYIAPPIPARDYMAMIDDRLYYPGLPNVNHAWMEFKNKHNLADKDKKQL
ncbi:MAG: hypothetical protein VYA01_04590, partial [Bacteroidota bacterium]|nr:hypothetical protein [Bacteroidota bacterium]